MGWVDDIPLDEVKALAHDRHATVNDVLMSSVSRALTTYGIIGVKVWIFKGEILGHDPMARDKRMQDQQPARG